MRGSYLYVCWKTYCMPVQQINSRNLKTNMTSSSKGTPGRKVQGLLDFILLQFLDAEPMREQQLILRIRKNFGVCFGPETIARVLSLLKNQGFVESKPNIGVAESPDLYGLTTEGRNVLTYAENALIFTCRELGP
jgi:DNA-binding PadR family transcriptional regulator